MISVRNWVECRSLAAMGLVAMLSALGCQDQQQAGVSPASQGRTVEQSVQIEAFAATPIHALVSGYVKQVPVNVGDRVSGPKFDDQGKLIAPGQPLIELSLPNIEAELRQRAAQLAQAEAEATQAQAAVKVAEAAVRTATARIGWAQAATRRAAAMYQKWITDYQRVARLGETASLATRVADDSREQLSAADADRQDAAAAVEAAEAAVDECQARLEKAQADEAAAQARIESARADQSLTQAQWEFGTLRAPFDAVVTQRNVHPGYLVSAGSTGEPLLVITRTDRLRLVLNVPQPDADLVRAGDEAELRVPALAGAKFTGPVVRTSWSEESPRRTLRAEVEIVNSGDRLRAGMTGYASIAAGHSEPAASH